MTLLVTGAGGLIGSAVVRAATARGEPVVACGRQRPRTWAKDIRFVEIDLLDREAVKRMLGSIAPRCLVHAAWETRNPSYWNDPVNVDWTIATIQMSEVFAAEGGRRFVQVGSCAEYDWSSLIEGRATRDGPSTRYGKAKLAAFHGIQAAMHGHGEAVEARIFWVYGPGEDAARFIPFICRSHLAGDVPALGSGQQLRDLVYADDAGEAILALCGDGAPQGVVDIGTGQGIRLAQVAERLAVIAGAARDGLGRRSDRQDDPLLLVANGASLRSAGWLPRVTLDDGLARTFAFWCDVGGTGR